MTITTRLATFFTGALVGTDVLGNRYFRARPGDRRWVIFRSGRDPSQVPPDWHGWLHHTTDVPPPMQHRPHYGWEKPPIPNLTGTKNAYVPLGHLQREARHAPTIAQYEPWKPK